MVIFRGGGIRLGRSGGENLQMFKIVRGKISLILRILILIAVGRPGFLFSGNITASTSITNDGNVHSYATHILRVLPLFGDEEYYTNEEEPTENLIMPEATRYTSISWDDTPNIGIFRVNYIVEYEGVKKEVSKMVIVCPLWLLFIIALILALIIIKIVLGRKKKA